MTQYLATFKIITFSALAFVLGHSHLSALNAPEEAGSKPQKKTGLEDSATLSIKVFNKTNRSFHYDINYYSYDSGTCSSAHQNSDQYTPELTEVFWQPTVDTHCSGDQSIHFYVYDQALAPGQGNNVDAGNIPVNFSNWQNYNFVLEPCTTKDNKPSYCAHPSN